LKVTPFEFRRDLWLQKTWVPELLCSIVCVILCLATFSQTPSYDEWTDRRTHNDGIHCASIASCDKNGSCFLTNLQWKAADSFAGILSQQMLDAIKRAFWWHFCRSARQCTCVSSIYHSLTTSLQNWTSFIQSHGLKQSRAWLHWLQNLKSFTVAWLWVMGLNKINLATGWSLPMQ